MSLITLVYWIHLLSLVPFVVCHRTSRFQGPVCKPDEEEEWSYRGSNGPKHWGERYPMCNGNSQSPIAINSRDAKPNENLSKLLMNNYDIPLTSARIENNGHSVQVTPMDGVTRTISAKGSTYTLIQFHFHWGDKSSGGAEHTLNGKRYAAELHFVHRNSNREIAVVGVLLKEQRHSNQALQNIINEFPDILYRNTSTNLKSSVNLNQLLPANPSSFYRYDGSLTTPGCNEGVTWSVLPDTVKVGRKQMADFRKLYSVPKAEATKNCHLVNNYRPLQPLNGREVYKSQ